ncbi:hypothetical protein N9934_03090 [Desulfosarcina sp.]|nr:hypothetical protein [Desulfosarcina sp.]
MNIINKIVGFSFLLLMLSLQAFSQTAGNKWEINGDEGIVLNMDTSLHQPYSDNIEMAGKRVAGIVSYDIDKNGKLSLSREIFFPQLHQFKTSESSWFFDYRAYLQKEYSDELLPKLYIRNQQFVPGAVKSISINGILNFEHYPSVNGFALSRTILPSMDERMFVEIWTIRNTTDNKLEITSGNTLLQLEDLGAKGIYTRKVVSNAPEKFNLGPGEEEQFSIKIMAKISGEEFPTDSEKEILNKRKDFLKTINESLILETPDPVFNTLFRFSKIRASESIFESELGLIHSPGGGRYYVGIWANDQAEYINPFFPYLGYDIGNESAMNTFLAFANEINPEYNKIRYSFEVEGLVKPFLLDRGDAAMIAYGATHFALANGDENTANELWPLIEWCLEYNHRQLNEEGVVLSESDEMEGRIETGNANLSTSCLYYGALNHAVDLGISLGKPKSQRKKYSKQAKDLNQAIEKYFGAKVEGLDTYKYYKEHMYLRHWICLPLVVGIDDRKDETTEALFDRLWTDNGVHVEKNSDNEAVSKIFWDRGTLYALCGTLIAGETEISLEKLKQFSDKRLLGDRVPYVVEAYPEGNMAHLSAESALYCRVFTEGMFGIHPIGLKSFKLTPRLPESWDKMALKRIKAFGEDFNIQIEKKDNLMEIQVSNKDKILTKELIKPGDTFSFSFE